MDDVYFEKIADVPIPADGYSLVAHAVANDLSLLFLYVDSGGASAVRETFKRGIGVFPRPKLGVARRFRLVRATAGSLLTIELAELDVTFPLVDILRSAVA